MGVGKYVFRLKFLNMIKKLVSQCRFWPQTNVNHKFDVSRFLLFGSH